VPALLWLKLKYQSDGVIQEHDCTGTMETIRKEDIFKDVPPKNIPFFHRAKLYFPDHRKNHWRWQYLKNEGLIKQKAFFEPGLTPDALWDCIGDEFGIDLNKRSLLKGIMAEEHIDMTEILALHLCFLNKFVHKMHPLILEGKDAHERSELMRSFSVMLNNSSSYNRRLEEMKRFFGRNRGNTVCAGEGIQETLKRARDYFEQEDHYGYADTFLKNLYYFLADRDDHDGFYFFEQKAIAADGYSKRFSEKHSLDFAEEDVLKFVGTKCRFCRTIVMDRNTTERHMQIVLEEIKSKIEECRKKLPERNAKNMKFVLFIDDCLSTNLIGLVKEIIIDHSFKGELLPQELAVIGSYNRNGEQTPPKSFEAFTLHF